jgi:predicted nucleic acid-binding protein
LSVIALDSSVLIPLLLQRTEADRAYSRRVMDMMGGGNEVVTPVFSVGESWAAATRSRLGYRLTPALALEALREWLAVSRLLLPGAGYWPALEALLTELAPVASRVFDCQIVALCVEHRVDEIWTADRRFPAPSGVAVTLVDASGLS